METVRAPKPRAEVFVVECTNNACSALMRCKRHELTKPHGEFAANGILAMKCPHCHGSTLVDLEKTAVKL